MPSVKDYQKKKQSSTHHGAHSKKEESMKDAPHHEAKSTEHRSKRRPGRDDQGHIEPVETLVKVVEVEPVVNDKSNEPEVESAKMQDVPHAEPGPEKIELNFYGSEMIRAKFPKPFDVAETIVTDWVNDGKFDNLELGHPLADMLTQQGLQKAKEVEKKVMASPLTEKAIMKAFEVGLKAQEIVNQVKSKVQKK